jgi:hypothetical protein
MGPEAVNEELEVLNEEVEAVNEEVKAEDGLPYRLSMLKLHAQLASSIPLHRYLECIERLH